MATQGQNSTLQRAINLQFSNPDSAIVLAETLLDANNDSLLSDTYEVIGIAHWVKGNYLKAIEAHQASLEIRKKVGYQSGVAYSLNNLGLNYQASGDARSAMNYYLKGKDVAEAEKDSSLQAKILGNIGTLYEEEHDIEKALEFYGESLLILEKLKENRILGNTLNNIALVYQQQGEHEKAVNFCKRSLAVRKLINDNWGVAQSLNLLGLLYSNKNELQIADSLFRSSLSIYRELNNFWGQSMVMGNIGGDAIVMNRLDTALAYCGESLELARKYKLEWEEYACDCLAKTHTQMGNTKLASKYLRELVSIKDSTHNTNSLAEISLLQKRFEFEKEQLKAQHILEQEKLKAKTEIERQKLLRQAALGLGMMGIALFFVAFRSYRTKQRDNDLLATKNEEISSQKDVIEDKNKHITDSIRYAQNLQAAILPKAELFEKHFSDFHILYEPKDIVSGDFYWMEVVDGIIYLAVADCTGHGVPGAMVSMVGYQGLNKAVLEEKRTSPAKILQRISNYVEEAFEKSGGSVKDGMDICLVRIDPTTKHVDYAGAHNALWVISNAEDLKGAQLRETNGNYRVFELKGDRRSIGGFSQALPFREKHVQLQSGDHLVLFSDGFADQFGGPKNKKMGSKHMRQLFLQKAMDSAFSEIDSEFESWKGAEEQVDDVSVIQVRL